MTKKEIIAERERLLDLLDQYETGKVTHFDEDERGHLEKDVTPERIASVRERITDLDRRLADDWQD